MNERYGLESQIKRSVVSIPANIAEGYMREYDKELIHFFSIAQGSLAETKCYIMLLKDLGYINSEKYEEIVSSTDEIGKMLSSFIYKAKQKCGMLKD